MGNSDADWAKVDPVFAEELLASIKYKCGQHLPLSVAESDYLAEAIGKILNGIDPKRALHLASNTGRKRSSYDRNASIYNCVSKQIESGKSLNGACKVVAVDWPKNDDENLSWQAVKKIYSEYQEAINQALAKKLSEKK